MLTYRSRMDGLMKQVKDTTSRPVLRYDYDAKGQTVASTDAGGTCVEYTHDPVGRVVAIRQGEKDLAQYTYASGNRIASMLYGNGVQTAYEYTPEVQVSRLHTRTADGTVLLDNQYTYDRSGNKIGCYGSEDQAEYRYDALDRLVEARYAGYGTEQLAYDASGNRVSRIWNGQRTSYTYDTRNRLLSLIEEALQGEDQGIPDEQADGRIIRYAYDAQGNLIREHKGEQTTTYAYDAFNRTSRVEQADGRVVQHGYDPEGLRIRLDNNGNVSHFIHDGWHVVNELDKTEQVQASYIRGHEWLTQLDDQGHMAYYVNNIHGDVTHLTGQQGQILNAYTYDAFGNMLSAREQRGNPFRYAGEMQDALTGHYYLRARFYNPQIARFTQEDTYRGDGLNLYAYVANNPIRYVDPSGYMCQDKGDVYDPNKRLIPGTPGQITKSDSSALGKNLLESMGLPRSLQWTGYQAQHIIPGEMYNHPVIIKIGMDINHANNGIFLPTPGKSPSTLSRHQGYHSVYNRAVKKELNKMDIKESIEVLERQIYDLQQTLKTGVEKGIPLYKSKIQTQRALKKFYLQGKDKDLPVWLRGGGATEDLWERWINK
ncbi:RHS repeat-associated core domain-containing protein [Paenibacillus xylanexedens]|uniref:RHS repeat-associated core domain-containing protein n=1 Tax=Paenibacillus xylanexedens TaxID=528191 RepID=UPI0016425ABB|nr:RHS repeat-associated core domain-containing protein [Paenibacillus xylanexedens]